MDERWFMVDLEADSPPIEDSPGVESLLDALHESHTLRSASLSAGGSLRGIGLTASVQAHDLPAACGIAFDAFDKLLASSGIPHEITRVNVLTEEAADRELDAAPDELAGVSEVAAMLAVSKQRVAELRSRAGFPAPIASLAAGPVWRVATLRRFLADWSRQPGRPRKAAAG